MIAHWRLATVLVFLSFSWVPYTTADETGWRGDGTGRFPQAKPVTQWSDEQNVRWQVKLPGRGYSCPVVVGDRIFLTAEPSSVLCLSAADGATVWHSEAGYVAALGEKKVAEIEEQRRVIEDRRNVIRKRYDALKKEDPSSPKIDDIKAELKVADQERKELEKVYPKEKRGGAGNAAATPLCDGQRVYCVFGTGIIAAYELTGKRVWIKHFEAPTAGFGHSASPVLADGKLIVHIQDMVGLDPATGEELWRASCPPKFGSPVVARVGQDDVVFTPSGCLVRASNGEILATKLFQLSNNSPVIHDRVLYAHESGKTKAFRVPQALSDPVELEQLWESSSTRDQRMASAICHNGLLFAAGRKGIIDVVDAETGQAVYKKRLDIGEIFASITLAGDYVFVCGRDGKTLVLQASRDYEEVAVNKTNRISSTPVFVNDTMYLRAGEVLYSIGGK